MFLFGMLGMTAFPFFRIFDVKSLVLVLVTAALYGLAQGAMASNKAGLIGDACDYVYIQTKKQCNSAVSAVYTVATNISMLIATSLPMYLLSGLGYVSGQTEQSEGAIRGITILVLVVPLCINVLVAIFFGKFFPIGKKEVPQQLEKIREMNESEEK